jgi:hypothetical protein
MAALYTDENVPAPLVDELVRLGHEVLTAQADGRANQKIADADALARATALGRAVLTNNWWDFVRLHRQSASHAGLVVFPNDPDHAALAGRINAAVAAQASMSGAVVHVYRPSPIP